MYDDGAILTRCTMCGRTIRASGIGRPPKYCADCRAEATRLREKERHIRKCQMTPPADRRDYHLLRPLDDWGDAPCFSHAEIYYMLQMRILPPGAVLEREGEMYRVTPRGKMLVLERCELTPSD